MGGGGGERKIEAEMRAPDNRNMTGELRKVRGKKMGDEVEVLVSDDTGRHQRSQREWRELSGLFAGCSQRIHAKKNTDL